MGKIIKLNDEKCLGIRYLACGDKDNEYIISGTPGNALGVELCYTADQDECDVGRILFG